MREEGEGRCEEGKQSKEEGEGGKIREGRERRKKGGRERGEEWRME